MACGARPTHAGGVPIIPGPVGSASPSAAPSATAAPAAPARGTRAGWGGHVGADDVVARLRARGVPAAVDPRWRALPPGSGRSGLLWGALDEKKVVLGDGYAFTVSLFASDGIAEDAFVAATAGSNTVTFLRPPYFLKIGDALVTFVTDDVALAMRLRDALR